jgi:hypothetical protein
VKNLVTFVRRLPLRQILTVFLASVMLVVTTACNNGDTLGARPNNPPVQMGGNNNPHTKGGDGYTQYKMSTDPKVERAGDRADLQLVAPQLIAAKIDSNAGDLLYPGENATDTANPAIGTRGQRALQQQTQEFPKQRQPVIDRSDPSQKILERVGEQFKDASEFLNDTGDAAVQRPEMQPNPSINRRSSVPR